MVAIPGVQHSLVGVGGHHAGLVEGGHSVVSLPGAVLVHWLEIHCPPGCIVLLWNTDHALTPCGGGPTGHLLNDADGLVPVKPSLHLVVPMERNRNGALAGYGLDILLDVNLDRGAQRVRL